MRFEVLFVKVGRVAFFIPLEFAIALPDRAAVFTGGVPHLCPVNLTAITADQLSGKGTIALGAPGAVFASGKFQLNSLPFLRTNDGRMAVLDIVLRNLALVENRGDGTFCLNALININPY